MGFFSLFRQRKPRQPDRVSFTDEAVTRFRPDGVEEQIRWDALCEVSIATTDEGPMQDDVFFLLIASDGKSGCVVPQTAEGCDHLLARLQKLPGFDHEAVIKAMVSASNAKFLCWQRPATRP
jgi:hypothetical protein